MRRTQRAAAVAVTIFLAMGALATTVLVARAESPNPADPTGPSAPVAGMAPNPADPGAPSTAAPLARAASENPPSIAVVVPSDAPSFASDVPSAERSTAPSAAEWRDAKPVKLTRRGPRAASCEAKRVREWLRVRCQTKTFAISLLGGANEGLSFWIGGEAEGQFGEVQLPLRRGDRRVVQLWATESDSTGTSVVEPSLTLQELWADGDAAPTVTVL